MEFIKKEKNGISYYSLDEFDKLGIKNMFTTVLGGVSFGNNELNFGTSVNDTEENVIENFRRTLALINSDCENAVRSKQTHSDIVIEVDESFKGEGILKPQRFLEADGLITDISGLSLVVFYADCVPILIADRENRTVCAVHSGWRGTQSNIVSKAVEKMVEHKNCKYENLIAAIGPCIGMCHFEVQKNVYDVFVPVYGKEYGKEENGKYFINLGKIVSRQLEICGLKKENIAFMDKCTYCNEEFYSYRRQGDRAGRMSAIICS